MIQLHPDCLIFETAKGESIPCSAETVTIELIGEAASHLDPEIVQEAAAAVVHYFNDELGRMTVSIAEFSLALERVLQNLGIKVISAQTQERQQKVIVSDLSEFATQAGTGLELIFFTKLREEMRVLLRSSPEVVRFKGLRTSVRVLTGTKKWTASCQRLNDQIVDYMRECLSVDCPSTCNLVIQ